MPMTKELEDIVERLVGQDLIIKEAQAREKAISEEFADHNEHLDEETSAAIIRQLPYGYHAYMAMEHHIRLQFGLSHSEVRSLARGRKKRTYSGKGKQRCPTTLDKKS